jgi:serine/threonine protein kinase
VTTDDAPDGAVPEPGQRIDRFVVTERLGEGSMGVVLRAWDSALHRDVAIKWLRPDDRGPLHAAETHGRLVREAQALARLSHPNVVGVFDLGTHGGQVYLVMELVQGETLDAWLARRPRGRREILDVFAHAGRGLAAAHAAGLVHRDFKPQNVLIGADGVVRVSDFGLVGTPGVREATPSGAEPRDPLATPLTHTGVLLGTPSYMAPGGAIRPTPERISSASARRSGRRSVASGRLPEKATPSFATTSLGAAPGSPPGRCPSGSAASLRAACAPTRPSATPR